MLAELLNSTQVLSLFLLDDDGEKNTGKLPCALLKSIREESPQDDIQNHGGTDLSFSSTINSYGWSYTRQSLPRINYKIRKALSKYEEPTKGATIIDEAWLQEATRLCELALGGIKAMKGLVQD